MEACGLAACWLRPSLPGNIALAPMLAIDVVGSRRWVGVVANGVDAAALLRNSFAEVSSTMSLLSEVGAAAALSRIACRANRIRYVPSRNSQPQRDALSAGPISKCIGGVKQKICWRSQPCGLAQFSDLFRF